MPPLNAPFPRANGAAETTLTGLKPASNFIAATKAQPTDSNSSQHYFQSCTHVEVLGTQGAQPLASWKVTGPSKALQKVFDRGCKSYVFSLGSTGLKLQTPIDARASLGIAHHFLALQALVGDGQNMTLELLLTDSKAARRRIILSTVFSEAKTTTLHCQVPLHVTPNKWTTLVLPMAQLASLISRGGVFKC
ncbi:hypothetical protein DUNSADRAFT_9733, partial [Dunaliella salina]